MKTKLIWDEVKRRKNIQKHGFDFADASEVLISRYRMDVPVVRDGATRVISFRPASNKEREVYDVWLENECDDS